ncbi:hypothetical protein QTP88_025281 [Uroleucon formosanum]
MDSTCQEQRVELLNAEFQKISLNFHEVKIKIKRIISLIEHQRESGFDDLRLEISTNARELNIKELNNQRPKKIPNIFIQNSELGSPSSALLKFAKSRDVSIQILQDAEHFIKSAELFDMLSEFFKLLQIILTIPVSSCTAEMMSFSALRRLKTFFR